MAQSTRDFFAQRRWQRPPEAQEIAGKAGKTKGFVRAPALLRGPEKKCDFEACIAKNSLYYRGLFTASPTPLDAGVAQG
ncbi:hypothetical protein [Nisaea sp.]|uniref:hypothetical protein n=1 Tax=Nisaea sp. TaxID=2024842 RepID=UPI003B51A7AC